ncbi:hypothetical protein DRJ16_03530 [Candidatus Woesearchaeota archaeon]|nr:MAG: hypothetical protein DRJ16_03530 [Candidatus Woesearchaeota archaeon]
MKTEFAKLTNEIESFEKKAGFEKTSKKQLSRWLKEETKDYEKAKTKSRKSNKLMDIIILTLQLAHRDKISLDDAWKTWWKKSGKYLK